MAARDAHSIAVQLAEAQHARALGLPNAATNVPAGARRGDGVELTVDVYDRFLVASLYREYGEREQVGARAGTLDFAASTSSARVRPTSWSTASAVSAPELAVWGTPHRPASWSWKTACR
jgi:23S rRNA G2069 N7-methylase RlmK/C1962 C5-methylase RlmI